MSEILEKPKNKWRSMAEDFFMDVVPVQDGVIVFVADCARKILARQWHPSDASGCYIDLLEKLEAQKLLPKNIWVDPCAVASCRIVENWCADHGIVMRFAGPAEPTAKGKMERAFSEVEREYENRRKSKSR